LSIILHRNPKICLRNILILHYCQPYVSWGLSIMKKLFSIYLFLLCLVFCAFFWVGGGIGDYKEEWSCDLRLKACSFRWEIGVVKGWNLLKIDRSGLKLVFFGRSGLKWVVVVWSLKKLYFFRYDGWKLVDVKIWNNLISTFVNVNMLTNFKLFMTFCIKKIIYDIF